MANKGTEAKTLAEKDAERAEKMVTEAQKRELRKKIKEEIEEMELNLKYYSYQMQLHEVYSKWIAWQKMMQANQEENVTTSDTVKEPEPKEETPIVEMK